IALSPYLKIQKGHMRDVLFVAVCGGPLTMGLLYWGLALGNASVIAIVTQLSVPFLVLISIILFREKLILRRWLGIGLAFFGVMVIAFDPSAFDFIWGMVIATVGIFISCISTVYQRKLTNIPVTTIWAW